MENKDWYNKLKKSQLNPPNWVFSVVWPILYALMINSLILVWNDKKCFPYCPPMKNAQPLLCCPLTSPRVFRARRERKTVLSNR